MTKNFKPGDELNAPLAAPLPATSRGGQYMALAAAFFGWMFDGLEMGLFPLVARPALFELIGPEAELNIGTWMSWITAGFLVGAAAGGLLFGWLGDRVGRVRAMVWSVLTYAIFSGLCGFATSPLQLAVLRFIAALGMGGEWSLGVALVMEIWPSKSRPMLAGLIGAAANVGFLLIALVGLALARFIDGATEALRAIGLSEEWVTKLIGEDGSGWRLLMFVGAMPAVLTFVVRIFVPESERWRHAAATTPAAR
ncbi:MAG: MFS transporter, partial [Pirellulales bacterium]